MTSEQESPDDGDEQVSLLYKLSWVVSDLMQKAVNGLGWLMLLVVRPGRAIGLLVQTREERERLEAEWEARITEGEEANDE